MQYAQVKCLQVQYVRVKCLQVQYVRVKCLQVQCARVKCLDTCQVTRHSVIKSMYRLRFRLAGLTALILQIELECVRFGCSVTEEIRLGLEIFRSPDWPVFPATLLSDVNFNSVYSRKFVGKFASRNSFESDLLCLWTPSKSDPLYF